MRFEDLKVTELTDIIAVIGMVSGLFLAIVYDQRDLALALGAALAGITRAMKKD